MGYLFYKGIRPLSKPHLVAKIAIFGIFSAKFFDHVYIHALKIFQKICIKVANFIKQSEFRKRSIEVGASSGKDGPHLSFAQPTNVKETFKLGREVQKFIKSLDLT